MSALTRRCVTPSSAQTFREETSPDTAPQVFTARHGLQVSRVDAVAHAAEVIYIVPGWNIVVLPAGFGGLHVLFGLIIAVKYGG